MRRREQAEVDSKAIAKLVGDLVDNGFGGCYQVVKVAFVAAALALGGAELPMGPHCSKIRAWYRWRFLHDIEAIHWSRVRVANAKIMNFACLHGYPG